MTPYLSGFPIDAILYKETTEEKQDQLKSIYQSYMGQLVWLATLTRRNLSTAISLLSLYVQAPSQGHIDTARYIRRYLKLTINLCIDFSSKDNTKLTCYIHFPLNEGNLDDNIKVSTFYDTNWGPQDVSAPVARQTRDQC